MNELMTELISQIHILNAWILVVPAWLIGILVANFSRKGVERATDISWYRPVDKFASFGSMFLMIMFMIISVFIQIDFMSPWFFSGLPLVVIGFAGHFAAKIAYMNAKTNLAVTRGIYRFSRNPMYTFFSLVLLGTAVASRSILLAGIWLPSAILMHILVIGEERYCIEKYGETYQNYMKEAPRYFLFL